MWDKIVFPSIRLPWWKRWWRRLCGRSMDELAQFDLSAICSVQPMSQPAATTFYLDYTVVPPRPLNPLWVPITHREKTGFITSAKFHDDSCAQWKDLTHYWSGTFDAFMDDIAAIAEHDRLGFGITAKEQCRQWFEINRVTPDCTLYMFSTDAASWAALAGRAGYVALKNSELVAAQLTRMS